MALEINRVTESMVSVSSCSTWSDDYVIIFFIINVICLL